MNLIQYLSNPSGKGSAVLPTTSIKNDLDNQFNMLRDKMKMKIYTKGNILIYHIGIPSRKSDKVIYDVIIEYNLSKVDPAISTINTLEFNCFSNCPSFTYTYAYIFDKNKILCPWLRDKYSREVLRKAPDTRNEYRIIGFERSIYLALKYITMAGRNKIQQAKFLSTSYRVYSDISRNVLTSDDIDRRYKMAIIERGQKPSKEATEKTPDKKRGNKTDDYKKRAGMTKVTKTTKRVGTSAKTKRI